MAELKKCPFCGSTDIYETYTEEYLGTKNPEIFCNSCKAIFSIEDNSPYLNCDEDYKYRREKTIEAWNKRAEEDGKVIHCLDCRYENMGECEHKFGLLVANEENYCSYGERREGQWRK